MPDVTSRRVFISYSHKDQVWLERLREHLKPLEDAGVVVSWDDTKILPGERWEEEIETALAAATVAVLLVSPHFLASAFIVAKELAPALKKAAVKGLTIIWVPVSSSAYEETDLRQYQAVHDPSRPLDTLTRAKRSRALVQICKAIRGAPPEKHKPPTGLPPPVDPLVPAQPWPDNSGVPARRSWGWTIAFAVILLVFHMWLIGFGPPQLAGYQQWCLMLLSALLAGLFVSFLTGSLAIQLKAATRRANMGVRGAGGMGAFALVIAMWQTGLVPIRPGRINQPLPVDVCQQAREANQRAEDAQNCEVPDVVLGFYQQAQRFAESRPGTCDVEVLRAIRGKGDCHRLKGEMGDAEMHYRDVLERARGLSQSASAEEAYACRGLAEVYATDPNRRDAAAAKFAEAERLFNQEPALHGRRGLALVCLGRARLYLFAPMLSQSLGQLQNLANDNEKLLNSLRPVERAYYHYYRAQVEYLYRGQSETIIELFRQALNELTGCSNTALRIDIETRLINALIGMRRCKEARNEFDKIGDVSIEEAPGPHFTQTLVSAQISICEGNFLNAVQRLDAGLTEVQDWLARPNISSDYDRASVRPMQIAMQLERIRAYVEWASSECAGHVEGWHDQASTFLQKAGTILNELAASCSDSAGKLRPDCAAFGEDIEGLKARLKQTRKDCFGPEEGS